MKVAIALLVLALASQAAGVEGNWTGETLARGKKTNAKKTLLTLDLKTQDGVLGGTVELEGAKKSRSETIRDPKVDDSTIRFTTAGKKAEPKIEWTMTLKGDQLTGTLTREGAKHGRQFVAKRAN